VGRSRAIEFSRWQAKPADRPLIDLPLLRQKLLPVIAGHDLRLLMFGAPGDGSAMADGTINNQDHFFAVSRIVWRRSL